MSNASVKKSLLWTAILIVMNMHTMAQQERGTLNLKYWGVTLTLPSGWSGVKGDDALGVAADDGTGMILIMKHSLKSLTAVQESFAEGMRIGDDVNMYASSEVEVISTNQAGAQVQGIFNGAQAMGYLLGIVNAKGAGLTIFALTTPENYDAATYAHMAKSIAASVKFGTPVAAENAAHWQTKLSGAVLSAFESYNGGAGGGYSSEVRIDLCANGNCHIKSQSSVSVYGGDLNGGSSGGENQDGKWKIGTDIEGHAMLNLFLADGSEYAYLLSESSTKVLLSNKAYTRTTAADGHEWGPRCEQ
jgi:hypothetical protein